MSYKAFIVGINTLGLKYCSSDAQNLSIILEKHGYEILPSDECLNSKYSLQAAFDLFIEQTAQTDTVLLYLSGHALMEKGKLWFVLADDASKSANKLNINEWLELLCESRANNKLVILDCCSAAQGIVELRLELSDKYLVLAASAQLEKSIELESLKASFFTNSLIKHLDNPSLEMLESGDSLSIQKLHSCMSKEAQEYNSNNDTPVPIPRLIGSNVDFYLAVLPSAEMFSVARANAEARSLLTVELRYRKLLLDSCDIVSLANLPEQDRHLATRPLELRRLYAPLRVWVDFKKGQRTKDSEWEEIEKSRLKVARSHHGTEMLRREHQRASVGERLAEARRLVVLGDPGAGKTTLTRWISTAYLLRLKGDANWRDIPDIKTLPDLDWLPIIVRCRDLEPTCLTGTLDDILCHTLRKAEMGASETTILHAILRERIKAGTALLILDGLDEITDPILRAGFCQQLERIHIANPDAPIIATSRIVGYREMGYQLGRGFEHVTLADMEPNEKDDFARRWCDLTELPERRLDAVRELIHDIHSNDRIERMTGNPMLLTTMALVKRKVGKLPNRRADLYWEAVQVLLNWRREVDKPLDPHEAIPQLEYVAYAMCDRGVQQLRRDEILELIVGMRLEYPNVHQARNHTPEEFLNCLEARTGLIVEAGRTRHLGYEEMVYEFRHLTFQEYLAACALVSGHFPDRDGQPLAKKVSPLAGRMAETAFIENGEKEMAVVENWREALRLCVAICRDDDVDSILRAILTPVTGEPKITSRARTILTVLCLADEPNVSEELARETLELFASLVKKGDNNFEIRTGVHVAAVSVAETRWATLLCQYLTREFCRQDPLVRDYWGDIAGLVFAKSAPSEANAYSTWWSEQSNKLQSGMECQAIQVALGVTALAATGKSVQITPSLISSLLDRLTGSIAMAHAAAEALAALNGYNGGRNNTAWRPTINNLEQIINYVSDFTNDSEAVRFLSWILGDSKVEAAVGPLIKWLKHSSAGLRQQIAYSLAEISSEHAVEPLISLFNDIDTDVRSAAAGAFCSMMSEQAIMPLITMLDDAEVDVRVAAVGALGVVGGELIEDSLFAMLNDAEAEVRCVVAGALGNMGSERTVEALFSLLDDTEEDVRSAAIGALCSIRNERVVEPLIALLGTDSEMDYSIVWTLGRLMNENMAGMLLDKLQSTNSKVRVSATRVLGELKWECALESLSSLLADADSDVRSVTAKALGEIGNECVIDPLIVLLKDAAANVRSSASSALGVIANERTVESLIDLLKDTDEDVRSSAAIALGKIANESAVEPLTALLKDTESNVRRSAANALGEIANDRTVDPIIDLLNDTVANVRSSAVNALGKIANERAVEPLLALLKDSSEFVSNEAAIALGKINSECAVESLLALLENSDTKERCAAIISLGKMKCERALELLISCLKDSEMQVRSAAARALADIGSELAVESLIALLEDLNGDVCNVAAIALGKIKDERAVEPLLSRLVYSNWEVRNASVIALGDIGDVRAVNPLFDRLDDYNDEVRKNALSALSRHIEPETLRLLTVDLDGKKPFIDPRKLITIEQVNYTAHRLKLTSEIVRVHYESLASEFKLHLRWVETSGC